MWLSSSSILSSDHPTISQNSLHSLVSLLPPQDLVMSRSFDLLSHAISGNLFRLVCVQRGRHWFLNLSSPSACLTWLTHLLFARWSISSAISTVRSISGTSIKGAMGAMGINVSISPSMFSMPWIDPLSSSSLLSHLIETMDPDRCR